MKRVSLKILSDLDSSALPLNACEVSILLADDKTLAKLNETYRGKSGPTDVLSFSQIESPTPSPESDCLGDIVVSLERVTAQADVYGVSTGEELLRLVTHGLLHLFGYEHENVEAEVAQAMFDQQDELVDKYRNEFRDL